MAGLSVVELLEKVCSDDGVVSDEGVELMVGRCWGVDGRVGVSGHRLVVEGAERVSTKGCVGLAVFEWRSLFQFAVLGSFSRCWWFGGVAIVKIPHRRWEVPVEGWQVEGVVAVGLVR